MFLTSQLLATLHSKIKLFKPKLCLKMASWTPEEGPRRAQDGPRRAQDGPKKGRRVPGESRKIIPGPLLGGPGGRLEAKIGLGRLDLGVQGGPKLRCQKHQKTLGKSMFLAEFWRQRAFRKLAKWLFGGLLVGLKA